MLRAIDLLHPTTLEITPPSGTSGTQDKKHPNNHQKPQKEAPKNIARGIARFEYTSGLFKIQLSERIRLCSHAG